MTRGDGGDDPVLSVLRLQRRHLDRASPLYAAVLDAVIDDVAAGGACRAVLETHRSDPFGSALGLRFLGAVHRIVLAGGAPELAAHYPSAGGVPGAPKAVGAAFVAAVEANAADVAAGTDVPVQTNEPGRSASLLGGFLAVTRATARPLRVLEVGASAGLNLRWDHFSYRAGTMRFGPDDSPLSFVDPFRGRAPDLTGGAEVVWRRGCDPNPIDASTPAGAALLRSFVWPDQPHRLERLVAAMAVAARVPAVLDRAGAAAWLTEQLTEPVPDVATVVVHSIVMQYLDHGERARLVGVLDDAGRRASARAPLAWLRMEPRREVAEIRLTLWPGGHSRMLATSTFHGPPVAWRG